MIKKIYVKNSSQPKTTNKRKKDIEEHSDQSDKDSSTSHNKRKKMRFNQESESSPSTPLPPQDEEVDNQFSTPKTIPQSSQTLLPPSTTTTPKDTQSSTNNHISHSGSTTLEKSPLGDAIRAEIQVNFPRIRSLQQVDGGLQHIMDSVHSKQPQLRNITHFSTKQLTTYTLRQYVVARNHYAKKVRAAFFRRYDLDEEEFENESSTFSQTAKEATQHLEGNKTNEDLEEAIVTALIPRINKKATTLPDNEFVFVQLIVRNILAGRKMEGKKNEVKLADMLEQRHRRQTTGDSE